MSLGTPESNYMWKNLLRLSQKLEIEFNFSHERFPVKSLRSMRGFYFAKSFGKDQLYLHRLSRACWGENLDIADLSTLNRIVESLGLDYNKFLEFTEKNETKQKLREDTQRSFERGVFLAPTFFLGIGMYWGSPEILWYLETTF
jgi:2-hydroxychromene-2-carboxylate isomerase